ncbi:MAG: helix-turn-helix domain-containing protein, partial [Planktomarina sp.]|nr:helix-turn-helix domain-containing protein [Planktomarina sp.]
MPVWMPHAVKLYLAHTEHGHSIRSLARYSGVHPSTVSRSVRKIETLRDDPL